VGVLNSSLTILNMRFKKASLRSRGVLRAADVNRKSGNTKRVLKPKGIETGGKKEKALGKVTSALLYNINVNRTSLDHLLLGQKGRCRRECRVRPSISRVGKSGNGKLR
jgi:hypothetical protein